MTRCTTRSVRSLLDKPGKRALDVVAATLGLVLTLPISLAVALAIVAESGRPVLSRGWRVGRSGRIFRICEFRCAAVAGHAPRGIDAAGDVRVTRVGRFLRRTGLDDIPQLLNVLRGEMSLVGPAPRHPNDVRTYTAEQRQVLAVRPGITGAASVHYRAMGPLPGGGDADSLYRTVIMPETLRMELQYLEQRSFWSDLALIGATVGVLPRPDPGRVPAGRVRGNGP